MRGADPFRDNDGYAPARVESDLRWNSMGEFVIESGRLKVPARALLERKPAIYRIVWIRNSCLASAYVGGTPNLARAMKRLPIARDAAGQWLKREITRGLRDGGRVVIETVDEGRLALHGGKVSLADEDTSAFVYKLALLQTTSQIPRVLEPPRSRPRK